MGHQRPQIGKESKESNLEFLHRHGLRESGLGPVTAATGSASQLCFTLYDSAVLFQVWQTLRMCRGWQCVMNSFGSWHAIIAMMVD